MRLLKQLEFVKQNTEEDGATPIKGLPEAYVRTNHGSLDEGWDVHVRLDYKAYEAWPAMQLREQR